MLLEISIFDAYASAFEYARPSGNRQNNLLQYYSHPKWKNIPGTYTDDTEMSIAIAELLVEKLDWTPKNIANKFVEVFKRNGQRTGYAARFYEFLCSVNNGREFLERIKPDSSKSGAAMRANPIGILETEEQVIDYSKIQAKLTHNTDSGISAAVAVSLSSFYFLNDIGPKSELADYLEERIHGVKFGHDLRDKWTQTKVGEQGIESVHAAVQAIMNSDSMSSLLYNCVEYGGDTDTVAAIAGGAASCSKEIKQDIPENLILTLENGPYGRDFLIELDRQLFELRNEILKA